MLESTQVQEQQFLLDHSESFDVLQLNKPNRIKYISIAVAAFNNIATINILTFLKFFRSTFLHLRYLGVIGIIAEFTNLGFKSYKIAGSHLPRHVKIIAGVINAIYSLMLTTAMTATGLAMAKILKGVAGKVVSFIAKLSPFIFTFALGSLALINGYGLVVSVKDYVQKPWTRTPLNYLRLASKVTKFITYSGLTSVYIPLFATMGMVALAAGITAGGPIFWGVLAAGFAVLTIWKISKYIIQKKIEDGLALKASRAKLNPFETLKIDNQSPDWRKNLQTSYDNTVQAVTQHRKWNNLDRDEKQKLKQIQSSYELLKSERTVLMYNALNSVKELASRKKFCPYKVLNEPQKSRSFLDKIMPLSLKAWFAKRAALAQESNKQKQAEIELAYQIVSNSCLREYYDECKYQVKIHKKDKLPEFNHNLDSYLKTIKTLGSTTHASVNINQTDNEVDSKIVDSLSEPKVEKLINVNETQISTTTCHHSDETRANNNICLPAFS